MQMRIVTTASTTHLPEQKETIHLISMLRKEAQTGSIDDLAHIRKEHCLSDCLTKNMKPTNLVQAVQQGILPSVDMHPPFRTLISHKAYLVEWMIKNLDQARDISWFLGENVQDCVNAWLTKETSKIKFGTAEITEFVPQ